jgi:hypothetical protein
LSTPLPQGWKIRCFDTSTRPFNALSSVSIVVSSPPRSSRRISTCQLIGISWNILSGSDMGKTRELHLELIHLTLVRLIGKYDMAIGDYMATYVCHLSCDGSGDKERAAVRGSATLARDSPPKFAGASRRMFPLTISLNERRSLSPQARLAGLRPFARLDRSRH